ELFSGALTVGVGIATYFWARGGLSDLIYATFVWPLKNYMGVGHVSYGFGFADSFRRIASLHPAAALLLSIPFLVVLLLPLIVVILGLHLRFSSFNARTLPFWLVGWALWISEAHRPDIYHLVLGSPVLLVLGFSLMHEMRAGITIRTRQ